MYEHDISLVACGIQSFSQILLILSEKHIKLQDIEQLLLHGNAISSITTVTNGCIFPALKCLNISSNELEKIDGEALMSITPTIENLDVAANKIDTVSLPTAYGLTTLNLAFNRLSSLQFLSEIKTETNININIWSSNLQKLDLRQNQVKLLADLVHLRHCTSLLDLKFCSASITSTTKNALENIQRIHMNPVCNKAGYVTIVLSLCPTLQFLDTLSVNIWREKYILELQQIEQTHTNKPIHVDKNINTDIIIQASKETYATAGSQTEELLPVKEYVIPTPHTDAVLDRYLRRQEIRKKETTRQNKIENAINEIVDTTSIPQTMDKPEFKDQKLSDQYLKTSTMSLALTEAFSLLRNENLYLRQQVEELQKKSLDLSKNGKLPSPNEAEAAVIAANEIKFVKHSLDTSNLQLEKLQYDYSTLKRQFEDASISWSHEKMIMSVSSSQYEQEIKQMEMKIRTISDNMVRQISKAEMQLAEQSTKYKHLEEQLLESKKSELVAEQVGFHRGVQHAQAATTVQINALQVSAFTARTIAEEEIAIQGAKAQEQLHIANERIKALSKHIEKIELEKTNISFTREYNELKSALENSLSKQKAMENKEQDLLHAKQEIKQLCDEKERIYSELEKNENELSKYRMQLNDALTTIESYQQDIHSLKIDLLNAKNANDQAKQIHADLLIEFEKELDIIQKQHAEQIKKAKDEFTREKELRIEVEVSFNKCKEKMHLLSNQMNELLIAHDITIKSLENENTNLKDEMTHKVIAVEAEMRILLTELEKCYDRERITKWLGQKLVSIGYSHLY